MKIDIENAIIKGYDLHFEDPAGQYGRNFVFSLDIKCGCGGYTVTMNPRKIPQLLEILKLESTSELPNTSIIIEKAELGGHIPRFMQHFLASTGDKMFPINEGQYYGSNLYIKYPDDDFKDFLPKRKKKPSLGKKPFF